MGRANRFILPHLDNIDIRQVLKNDGIYRTVIDRINEGLMIVDNDEVIYYVNDRFCKLVEYTSKELVGRVARDFLIPDRFKKKLIRKSKSRLSGKADDYEVSILTKSGKEKDVFIMGMPVHNPKGKVIGSIGIHVDISSSKKAELALKESENRYRSLFEDSPVSLWVEDFSEVKREFDKLKKARIKDLGNYLAKDQTRVDELISKVKVLDVNRATLELYEVKNKQELLGNIEKIFTKASYQIFIDELIAIYNGATSFESEVRTKTITGRNLFVNVKVSIASGHEKDLSRVLVSMTDITEQKKAELLKEVTYKIAETAGRGMDIETLSQFIHLELSKILEVKNFYIALHDPINDMLTFPYYMDENYFESGFIPPPRKMSKGLSEYIIKTGKSLLAFRKDIFKLRKAGKIDLIGPLPLVWMGVPLKIEKKIIGVVSVQSYSSKSTYNSKDLELLEFVSGQVAKAMQIQQIETGLWLFKKLINQSRDSIFVIDAKTSRFLDFNDSACSNLGYTRKELLTKSVTDIQVLIATDSRWQSQMRRLRNRDVFIFEGIHRRKNGKEYPVEIHSNSATIENREYVVAVARDITERKNAEEVLRKQVTLRASERMFRQSLEKTSLLSMSLDLDKNITFINDQFLKLTGWKNREIIGKNWFKLFIPPKAKKLRREEIDKFLSRKPSKNKGAQFLPFTEYEIVTKHGENRTINWNMALMVDEKDATIGLTGIGEDITDRNKAQKDLLASEERYREIVESASDFIYKTDANGDFRYMNPVGVRIIGYTEKEMIGKHYTELIRKEYKQSVLDFYRIQFEERIKTTYYEFPLTTKKGKEIWIGQNVQMIMKDGWVLGYQAVARDITERRKVEQALLNAKKEAEESSKIKGEFLANVSHEIRTPMNGIMGMTDLLLQTPLDDDQKDFALIIKESSNNLMRIINDLLDLSKIDAKKIRLKNEDIFIPLVLEKLILNYENETGKKNIKLSYSVSPNVPTIIKADEMRFTQVLNNLVSNAIKFTKSGFVRIKVMKVVPRVLKNSRENSKKQEFFLRVEVIDSGIGIKKVDRSKLFQKFSQIDSTISRKYTGTGLGLAISRELVYLMGGNIDVISEEKKGSKFWFTIKVSESRLNERVQQTCVNIVGENKHEKKWLRAIFNKWNYNHEFLKLNDKLTTSQYFDKNRATLVFDKRSTWNFLLKNSRTKIELAKIINGASTILYKVKAHKNPTFDPGKIHFGLTLSDPLNKINLLQYLIERVTGLKQKRIDIHSIVSSPNRKIEKQRILLIEDNVINQKVTKEILIRQGYGIDIAANGKEGIVKTKKGNYDLILLDIQMPDMDGSDVLEKILRIKNKKIPPVVMLTANAQENEKRRFLKLGAQHYLTKPINIKEFTTLTSKILNKDNGVNKSKGGGRRNGRATTNVKRVINKKVFNHLKDIMGSEFEELIINYLYEGKKLILNARKNINKPDKKAFLKNIHTLKGTSASLGIARIAELAGQIELYAKDKSHDRIKDTLDILDAEFSTLDDHLNKNLW